MGAKLLLLITLSLALPFALDRAFPPDLSRYHDRAAEVVDRNGAVLRAFTAADDSWRFAVGPDEVAPLYRALLVAYEDKRFDRHWGVDPLAVLRAGGQALWHGRVVSGASTLTMQVARLLEPRPRTLAAKLVEMARAAQLERRFSKDEILAIYLTLAPFGGNLEGVRAAALAWFGKEPRHLTPAEAALLVALPQSPTRLRPDRADDAVVRRARSKVLDRAMAAGLLSPVEAEQAKAAPLPGLRHAFPFLAPHLTERLRAGVPAAGRIATTIDARIQGTAERLLRRLAEGLEPKAGVAALVVDNATREVLAYVGSGDFFDARRDGMVDMVQAVRSPGSTLKPLIYGLAFDRLIVHPMTVIADVPRRFGAYAPENFGGGHSGEVTVAEALQQSLNVPAVAVLDRLGPLSFDAALRRVGVTLHFDRRVGRATLPIALGGVGLSLEELVTLYGAFSHGGRVGPLTTVPPMATPRPDVDGEALMGEAAAWYVARTLRGAPRPPGYAVLQGGSDARGIAFKTGTSYGFRDAWAIGFTDAHTIGIWVGRPDGAPCLRCVGIEAAAPLLFRLFDLLPVPASAPVVAATPPAGVIAGGNADLPPGLRRFSDAPAVARHGVAQAAGRLRIAFPVDGSVVSLRPSAAEAGRLAALPLRAEGGRRPLRWLINDRPLGGGDWRRGTSWQPDGAGFVDVKVLDADGNVSSATVFVAALGEESRQ